METVREWTIEEIIKSLAKALLISIKNWKNTGTNRIVKRQGKIQKGC